MDKRGRRPRSAEERARIGASQSRRIAYRDAAQCARGVMYGGGDAAVLKSAAEEALRLAPPGQRGSWQRVLDALAAGRTVRVKTFPFRVIYPASDELIAEVESAFNTLGDE